MTCYHPLTGYRARVPGKSGKTPIVFSPNAGWKDLQVTLPCGQCVGCRLERSRQWATRIMHEVSLHDANMFLTLTYDPEHLPENGSLVKDHFQLFMKRYRKSIAPTKIRYFHCGEYGEKNGRPHYHAIIFGHRFDDLELVRESQGEDVHALYRSNTLDSLWGLGTVNRIGEATFESAAYCARYILKKVTGTNADEHYQGRDPEYVTMSLKPGIGAKWFEQYASDVYPSDEVIVRGVPSPPPKYYDKLIERVDPELFKKVSSERLRTTAKRRINNSTERLRVREIVKLSKIKMLTRVL